MNTSKSGLREDILYELMTEKIVKTRHVIHIVRYIVWSILLKLASFQDKSLGI